MQNILNRIVKCNIYVLVFLLPLFFLPFSFEIFEYNKQYLLFFLISSALFAWVMKQVAYDKEIRFKKSPIDYFVLGFLFVSLLSAIFSIDKASSLFGFYGRFSDGLIGLLGMGAFYFLITNTVKNAKGDAKGELKDADETTVNGLLKVFLWSVGAVISVAYFSIFGLWAKIGSFMPLPKVMLQITFNPISGSLEGASIFLAITAVLLASLLLNKTRIFYWILLLASLGLLVIIDFIPAWIILLVTLVLLLGVSLSKRIFRENVNRLLIPIFLVIVASVFLLWQPFRTNLPKEQVLPQAISWQTAAGSATDNVKNGFLGSGIGTFHYDFAKYKPQSFNQNLLWQIRFDRAGSYFSELLGTVGFLGLLIYLGIIGLFLLISWLLISKDFAGLPLVITFTALIISQLVYYQNTSLSFVFWLILGLSAVSWRAVSPASTQEKKISFKNFPESSLIFLTLVIVFGVAILAFYFYGARYYLADANYFKALSVSGEARVQNLQKAVNQNPNSSNYRQALARSYLAESLNEKDSSMIQSLVSLSIDQGRVATVLAPNQVSAWETLGVIYREIGNVAQGATEWGIKSFEKAIGLEPTNPVLYTELGKLYLVAGDNGKARDNFNKALEEKSDYSPAVIQLALLLERDNAIDEAIANLENLISKNSLEVEARFQLGRIYFNNGRTDEAITQFSSVTLLSPNHSNAHYSLGVAYAAQKKIQLAIQEFEKVLELNPDNPDIIKKLKSLRGY